ncbi:hypothetical protein ALQ95_200169 [Pseudomonas syringae pv. ribicola]|uniref:Uncharacterized protein n=1 Tax=Pseudomonas syringae pv. ribicola TaxID=55398 RepID=A0A3M2W3H4_PSESI|nr:hypothetical protein ALQ95_200169 [Pseudomonas syringae pv. ribicola]
MSAKGCEAAPKQAASVVSGASRWLDLLPVPGSSRTSPLVWLDLKGWWDEQFASDRSNSTDRGRPRPTPSTKSADKECFVQATIETSLRLWVKPLQAVKP